MLKNQTGSMVTSVILVSLGLAVAAGGFFFTNSVLRTTVKSAREAGVGNISEILMSRAAQAIAKNVVLCSEVYGDKCQIQTVEKAEEYGFSNIRQVDANGNPSASGKDLMLDAETCMQAQNEVEVVDPEAEPEEFRCDEDGLTVTASIRFAFVSLDTLRSRSLITGVHATDDLDRHAVQTTVKIPVLKGIREDGTKEFYNVETVAVIRRPRSFLRFEILSRGCERSCDLGDGLRNNAPCAGPLTPDTDSSGGSSAEVTVVNDGPGWIYGVKVFRRFIPDAAFADRATDNTIEVYDSRTAGNTVGIPPGESITFLDSGIPCFFEFVTVRTTGTEDSVSTSVTRSPLNSGRTTYAFSEAATLTAGLDKGLFSCGGILGVPCAYAQTDTGAENLEPANPLVVGEGGDTIPANRVVTRIVEGRDDPIVTFDPPQFDPDGGDGDGN